MRVVFPFLKITSNTFGQVWRPYAKIFVKQRNSNNWLERVMVVDTGADYTIFPKKDAFIFGIDLSKDCILETTHGVGGVENVYLFKNLEVDLGGKKIKIPVGFLDTNDVPALLGRQGFMELLKVVFEFHKVRFQG